MLLPFQMLGPALPPWTPPVSPSGGVAGLLPAHQFCERHLSNPVRRVYITNRWLASYGDKRIS